MKTNNLKNESSASYIQDYESTANKYIMRCFGVTMLTYTIAFFLNLINVFIIDKQVMLSGYIPSLIIFAIMFLLSKKLSFSDSRTKFIIFFAIVLTFTIIGSSITYHVVLISFLPFLCATIYSSKKFMWYVYSLTVISTFITVYGGYYWGLCDANMALLTSGRLQDYVVNGEFVLTQVNENPVISLFLFFVLPRCLTYIAFMAICSSIFTILNDSVEKARLTSELEKAKTEAENANLAKSKFIAKMSHEIRTPINAIMGINEMIISESHETEIKQYAKDVKDSSFMLLSIVNDILDSSKIESGKMEIIPVNYAMGSLLNDIYNMTNIKAREKKLNLIFDIDDSIPSEYYGDDKRIKQVLLNLLSNAVKYTEKGTITLTLSSRTENENAVLHFSVKDTGIGIKEEDVGKIYDEFQRIDTSRNRNIEGTGLGMTIVQMLLKLMNSELNITSVYEEGSEFSFDLVQKIVNHKPIGNFRRKIEKADRKSRIPFTAPDARILVVDDNSMNLKVFKGLLKNTQMQISEADSGRKCIDMVKDNRFDIIFLDHMMPGMDGIETLRVLRDDKLCEDTYIIMLTANAISGDKERYISEGFDDFLSKPIIPERLDKMIMKYLNIEEQTISVPQDETASPAESKAEVTEPKEKIIFDNITKPAGEIIDIIRSTLPEINIGKGLETCINDNDFYIEIFTDFVNLGIKQELVRYLNENDAKNYCIRIHGFKNNAYSVGAMELGDISYQMEQMSREGLPEEIKELQASLFSQFDKICDEFHKAVL